MKYLSASAIKACIEINVKLKKSLLTVFERLQELYDTVDYFKKDKYLTLLLEKISTLLSLPIPENNQEEYLVLFRDGTVKIVRDLNQFFQNILINTQAPADKNIITPMLTIDTLKKIENLGKDIELVLEAIIEITS